MLTLTIAGVDRTAWLAKGYRLDIEKVLSTETMHLAILDLETGPGAYRPSEGDPIVLMREDETEDGELLFGGKVANVIDEPIIDDIGTVTRIRCRDQMELADQVFVDPRTYESAPAREVFTPIVEEYLGPKGVTVISEPEGGPDLPELRIEDPVTSVRQVLDRITLQCGWPWRINGEKAAGIIEPGELDGPVTLSDDGQSVLTDPPLRWEKQVLTQATRIFMQTAVPDTGPGPHEYTEDWTADGIAAVVPVHVLPTETKGSVVTASEAFDNVLELENLPREASIRPGARLAIDWHDTLYTLVSEGVTDADGKITVTLVEDLERDVPAGHSVTFRPGSFVQLEINGVVTPMDGAPYVWHPPVNAMVYPGVAFTSGDVITYRTWVTHPTFVREWDPVAQLPEGWFDYENVIDQRITEEEGHTDLPAARAFAQSELARRLTPPKRVTLTTQIPGHYPLLMVPLDFPDRLVEGNYLVTETRIHHTNIDENGEVIGQHRTSPLFYELVLWEGDALGESWVQYFRGKNPSQGIRWAAIAAPPVPPLVVQFSVASHIDETTSAYSFDTTPTVGNLVVVAVMRANRFSASPSTMADNQGNTYTKQVEQGPNGQPGVEIWTAPIATASGTFTVTMTHIFIQQHCDVVLMELEGADLAAPAHQTGAAGKAFGLTTGTVDMPPLTEPCVVFGVSTVAGGATNSPATGWTLIASTAAGQGISVIAQDAPTAGDYDPTWNTNTVGADMCAIAVRAA